MEKLLEDLAAIDGKLDALLAGDELTDEQRAEHDKLAADRKRKLEAIDRDKARQAREDERAKLTADAVAAQTAADNRPRVSFRKTTPDSPAVGRQPAAAATAVRTDDQGRVTGFFEDANESVNLRFGESPDAQRRQSYRQNKKQNVRLLKASGYQPWGEFTSFGDFCRAGFEGHQHAHFRDRVHKHYAAVVGMSEGVGSDGGYTVMPEFAGGIIDRVYSNNLWSLTDNYTVSGNNMTFLANAETSRASGSRHGGLRGYWLGEGATATASKPTLREVTLKLAKLGVVVYLTDELIADGGMALEEYVTRKASEEFNFLIGDSLINGSGVGQPLGVLNSPSLISVAKETGQTAATLLPENVVKMYARFFAPNLGGMNWFHNQDIGPQLDLMTLGIGAAGIAVYMPPGGLSGSSYATLRGRPMQPIEFAATLGTQGDLMALDLGQMLSISKGGVAQAVSMHIQFLTDQLALRFIIRINAGPWENSAITPYKGSATQSSFVVLDTRS